MWIKSFAQIQRCYCNIPRLKPVQNVFKQHMLKKLLM